LFPSFGGEPRVLRSHCDSASVSPDGSVGACIDAHGHEIWLVGSNGENPRKLPLDSKDRFAALTWSPGGTRLAFMKQAESGLGGGIETISPNGGTPTAIAADPRMVVYDIPTIVWVPDGRLIFSLSDEPSANLWGSWSTKKPEPAPGNP
jgi:Tol biopolymer transport system component